MFFFLPQITIVIILIVQWQLIYNSCCMKMVLLMIGSLNLNNYRLKMRSKKKERDWYNSIEFNQLRKRGHHHHHIKKGNCLIPYFFEREKKKFLFKFCQTNIKFIVVHSFFFFLIYLFVCLFVSFICTLFENKKS